jgi:hypothetical protein
VNIAFRGVAIIGILIAGSLSTSAEAKSPERSARPPVSSFRIGLIGSRSPRMGPRLVMRGGYTPITNMVRPRFAGGMIDIYPSTRTGFRFSIGNRYFAARNFWRDAEQATDGLLYDPHMIRGGVGLVRAYRKYTPALTAGYDIELGQGLVAGIEGGAINGRAINPGPRSARFTADDRKVPRAGLNPIASVAIRYAF